MLLAGHLLLETPNDSCRLAPGYVRIQDDRIIEVVEGEIPPSCDFGGPETILSPGFIDAHVHLPQFDIVGAHGLPLLNWLTQYTFPAERRWEDLDFARAMTTRVFRQCLRHGTTSVCAYATVHYDAAKAALEIATSLGISGAIGQVLMDREAPGYLCREANQLIDEAAELSRLYPPGSSIAAAITPRFAITCTPELLLAAGKLAAQTGSLVQTHLAETIAECEFVSELFGGRSYVDVYNDAGLVSEKSIFGHGIYLDETDRQKLANSKSVIAHCPTANSFLRSGTMHRDRLLSERVRIAPGSDIGAGYERSMVRVARAMIEAASLLGDGFPTAADAWHSITAGNADALGFNERGRLRVGNIADVVLIEPDVPIQTSPVDLLSRMMFGWSDLWIRHVFVRGRSVE